MDRANAPDTGEFFFSKVMIIVVILIREAFYYVWYLPVIHVYVLHSLSWLYLLPFWIPIQIIRILDAPSDTWRENLSWPLHVKLRLQLSKQKQVDKNGGWRENAETKSRKAKGAASLSYRGFICTCFFDEMRIIPLCWFRDNAVCTAWRSDPIIGSDVSYIHDS